MKGGIIILFIGLIIFLAYYMYKSCAEADRPTKLCLLIPGMAEKFGPQSVQANKCMYRDAQGNFMTCEQRMKMLN